MEPSQVRRHVRESIERARQTAAARRAVNDTASRTWDSVRDSVVVPTWQQAAQVLRSEGYLLQVSTPGQAVRVTSEKAGQDGVELTLDTTGPSPILLLRVTRTRGREVLTDERVTLAGDEAIGAIDDEQACMLLLDALAPFFER
jgi:hypothetical protein